MLLLHLPSHSSTCCKLNFHFLFNIVFSVADAVKVLCHVMLLQFAQYGTVIYLLICETCHIPTSFWW